MRIREFDFDIDNVDADGLAQAQAVGAAGYLTLNGALISGGSFTAADGLGHQIGILSAGNDAGITFTIVGTDQNGVAVSEDVTGSAGAPGTAESAKYFKTVSSIYASGAAAGNVSAGTVDEICSKTIPVDPYATEQVAVAVNVTGTMNYDVQYAYGNALNGTTLNWLQQSSSPDFAGQTADTDGLMPRGITAIRFLVNSYTDTAEAQMNVNQAP